MGKAPGLRGKGQFLWRYIGLDGEAAQVDERLEA
jgi:hypothetical protein